MQELKKKVKQFIRDRDWEQYHAPKNLAMALSVEVTEILEIFQWKETEDKLSSRERTALEEEIGDVFIYLLELGDKFQIDPVEAAHKKLVINQRKYPADRVRGKAEKYTAYHQDQG